MGFIWAKSTQGNKNCQKILFADDQVLGHDPRALNLNECIGNADAVPTVATSRIKRRQSISTPADDVFSRRFDQLCRFHRKVDLPCCSGRTLVNR